MEVEDGEKIEEDCISPGGHLLMSKVEKEKEAGGAD